MSELPDPNDLANEAAESIVKSLNERKGLRRAWDEIDEDGQNDIKSEWAGLVHLRLVELDKHYRPQDQPPSAEEIALLRDAAVTFSWHVDHENVRIVLLLVDRGFLELETGYEGLACRPTNAGRKFYERIEQEGEEGNA